VDQTKIIIHSVQGFRVTQEKVSMRQQIIKEVLNDATLGSQIEVDKHVAAKDDIYALHEGHARIVG
jgi:hypothetical protein